MKHKITNLGRVYLPGIVSMPSLQPECRKNRAAGPRLEGLPQRLRGTEGHVFPFTRSSIVSERGRDESIPKWNIYPQLGTASIVEN